jgi:sortase (surface protein transpeptidase)
LILATTALLAVVAAVLIALGLRGSGGPPAVDSEPTATSTRGESADAAGNPATESPSADASTRTHSFGAVLRRSAPVALDIPRINVHSRSLVGLGLAKDGSIEVPKRPMSPGWFTPGPAPGQFGPAVIAGHVDSKTGPAVFYRLGELRRGDRVKVTRRDGSVATFVVDRVAQYAKDRFPTRMVYGTANRAELRLVTCSGTYDSKRGYLANTVAFAHLASARR